MEKQYKCGDIIEYLGQRYYVFRELKDDWWCISGYSFNMCFVPKDKLTKYVGRSELALTNAKLREWRIEDD